MAGEHSHRIRRSEGVTCTRRVDDLGGGDSWLVEEGESEGPRERGGGGGGGEGGGGGGRGERGGGVEKGASRTELYEQLLHSLLMGMGGRGRGRGGRGGD